jgi:hypothetical protein
MDHIKKELADSVPKVKKAEKQNASLVAELEASKRVIETLKVEFHFLNFVINLC